MDKQYLVFYQRADHTARLGAVVTIIHPPHDNPSGSALDFLVMESLEADTGCLCRINGITELPNAHWSQGAIREISLGNGHPATLECSANGWRIHATA